MQVDDRVVAQRNIVDQKVNLINVNELRFSHTIGRTAI
jgi:hypothetical protein